MQAGLSLIQVILNGSILIEELKQKFNVATDGELAKTTGVSLASINKWKANSAKITPKQIGNLIMKAKRQEAKSCLTTAVQPIVEYYEIDHAESKNGANWEPIPTDSERGKTIKQLLESSSGIYVFYNSQCRAIYIGKARKQNLWREMISAFNRNRGSQGVYKVAHPEKGQKFTPAYEKLRALKRTNVYLSDIAVYFSAFKVEEHLIDNIEAFMIRAFANDLTNVRMEKFKF